ncbi:MAG: ATP-binding protein [Candidatus Diapherotrites archaeon]|nr:ATP-binding protein [Candidatus Diapherotrites archaeon]
MEKSILKEVLLEQDKKTDVSGIQRSLMKKIAEYGKSPFVIIISGIRRCGKSTLMNRIKTRDSYYVNFDDERFINFDVNDFQKLYELLIELFGEKNIFLFDEIQNIPGWERFVRRLHDAGKKIYVTGSNATILSKELGTHLTGRNISFQLYPFSFREYLDMEKYGIDFLDASDALDKLTSVEKSKIKHMFNKYLKEGGFPEFVKTKKDEYLKNVYENIIYRDIITRYGLTKEKPIKETVYFAVSNIGKEISFNTIKKLTGLTSATTIKEYFEYLENSYLVFLISRYDVSLKKQAYYNKKAYFIDSGMARVIGFRASEDKGRVLENLVFLELKRKNCEIYFHRQKKECDFLVRQGINIVKAIQVTCYLEENKDREIAGLLEALNSHDLKEGLILTLDEEYEIKKDNKKITVMPVWKWMLENV